MFIKIPELLQQHFPSVYLCTYSIVSLLWAGHSFCSIIHLVTHFSSPSRLSFFCLDPVLFFCSCFLYLLTHPHVFTCLHFSICCLFRLFQHLFHSLSLSVCSCPLTVCLIPVTFHMTLLSSICSFSKPWVVNPKMKT